MGWSTQYPHPYFVRKFFVFFDLRTGFRCKILRTKKFPAKSSKQRSYTDYGRGLEGMLLRIIVRRRREIICKGLAVQAMAFGAVGALRAHMGAKHARSEVMQKVSGRSYGTARELLGYADPEFRFAPPGAILTCLPPGGEAAN
jgi:hypothetical protein